MAQHALCMIDNDGSFSVICEIPDNNLAEWEKLAEYIEDRIKDVASGRAELTAYTEWYQKSLDPSDYLYKYGDFPGIYVMEKVRPHTYACHDSEFETDDVWESKDITELCLGKYDGGIWTLGLDEMPELLRNT